MHQSEHEIPEEGTLEKEIKTKESDGHLLPGLVVTWWTDVGGALWDLRPDKLEPMRQFGVLQPSVHIFIPSGLHLYIHTYIHTCVYTYIYFELRSILQSVGSKEGRPTRRLLSCSNSTLSLNNKPEPGHPQILTQEDAAPKVQTSRQERFNGKEPFI